MHELRFLDSTDRRPNTTSFRLYLTVVVGTHELVKMLRLVADLVLVLGEHLATLVNI